MIRDLPRDKRAIIVEAILNMWAEGDPSDAYKGLLNDYPWLKQYEGFIVWAHGCAVDVMLDGLTKAEEVYHEG